MSTAYTRKRGLTVSVTSAGDAKKVKVNQPPSPPFPPSPNYHTDSVSTAEVIAKPEESPGGVVSSISPAASAATKSPEANPGDKDSGRGDYGSRPAKQQTTWRWAADILRMC